MPLGDLESHFHIMLNRQIIIILNSNFDEFHIKFRCDVAGYFVRSSLSVTH